MQLGLGNLKPENSVNYKFLKRSNLAKKEPLRSLHGEELVSAEPKLTEIGFTKPKCLLTTVGSGTIRDSMLVKFALE